MISQIRPTDSPTACTITDRVYHHAEERGYGYKGANLLELESLAKAFNEVSENYHVTVPDFFLLSSFDTRPLLGEQLLYIEGLWNTFQQSLAEDATTLSEENAQQLEAIQQALYEHFAQNRCALPALQEWIKEHPDAELIVRSSGREDSDALSNAGGNASLPCQAEQLMQTLGQVLASYCSEQSIGQRLLAGDKTLRTDPLFLPAVIQVLINEPKHASNKAIPRPGVMLTHQPDKAQGVTFVGSCVGSNELFVGSHGATDGAYIGSNGVINQVIRRKPFRMVQRLTDRNQYKLLTIPNQSKNLVEAAALSKEALSDLKRIASKVESVYQKAMDIEYLVDEEQRRIYLLQARPLLDTRPAAERAKSYLDYKQIKSEPQIEGNALLDGNAYVRQITQSEQLLFVDDLPQALEDYRNSDKRDQIQAIITRRSAPAASHEAVNLRPSGVVVFVPASTEDYNKLRTWAASASPEQALLLCPQRGRVLKCSSAKEAANMIKQGCIRYPMPLELSVPPSQVRSKQDLIELEARYQRIACTGPYTAFTSFEDCLESMVTGSADEARASLRGLLRAIHSLVHARMRQVDGVSRPQAQLLFRLFEQLLKKAEEEVLPALSQAEPQSTERLYALHWLEALLMQRPSSEVVDSLSIRSVLEDEKSMQVLRKRHSLSRYADSQQHADLLLQLDRFGKLALRERTRVRWEQFCALVAQKAPDRLRELASLIIIVQKLDMGVLWLNCCFQAESLEDLDELIAQLKTEKQTLTWIAEKRQQLAQLETKIGCYEQPAYVREHAKSLERLYLDELIGIKGSELVLKSRFQERFANSSRLGKLGLMQLHRQMVDVYDRIIKAVSGSPHIPDPSEKVALFVRLLRGYSKLMRASLGLLSFQDERYLMLAEEWTNTPFWFQSYVEALEDGDFSDLGFNKLSRLAALGHLQEPELHLQARQDFAVNHIVIGSKSDYNYGVEWPERAEEYFTTFHQNMEATRRHLQKQLGFNESILPGQLRGIVKLAQKKLGAPLSSIELNGSQIEIVIQVTLRQHSARFAIECDLEHPEAGYVVDVQAMGYDEHRRWDQIAAIAAIIGDSDTLPYTLEGAPRINYKGPTGASFRLHIPEGAPHLKAFLKTVNWMLKTMSMEKHYPEEVQDALEDLLPNFDWNRLPATAFRNAPYFVRPRLEELVRAKAFYQAAELAKETLRAVADQGDYRRSKRLRHKHGDCNQFFYGVLGQPDWDFIPNNYYNMRSNRLIATLHLIYLARWAGVPEALDAIEELLADSDWCAKDPETAAALEVALDN